MHSIQEAEQDMLEIIAKREEITNKSKRNFKKKRTMKSETKQKEVEKQ